MKIAVYCGVLFLAVACSGVQKPEAQVIETEKEDATESIDTELKIVFPNEEVLETMEVLEAEGDSCKQFFFYKDIAHFIVKGTNGTGISTGNEWLLTPDYEKVYNPEMTQDDCIEVRKGDYVGMVHLGSGKVLAPQFDYIAPQSATDHSVSYGFKDGGFYRIEYKNEDFQQTEAKFSLMQSLEALLLDFNGLGGSLLFDADHICYAEDGNQGNGLVLLPSYLENFEIWPSKAEHIIPDSLDISFPFGNAHVKLKTEEASILGNIATFFIETYEENFDARGASSQQAALVSVNKDNHNLQAVRLFELKNSAYTVPYKAKFIQPDLLEFETEVEQKGGLYDVETVYKYYKIDSTGKIELLDRDRHFDCSHYTHLNEHYFTGLYGHFVEESELTPFLHLEYVEHLPIKALDVMRNEIYAEYGYHFKSKEWQDYFAQFEWYEPRFDNVDDQLTDLEKENIKTILAAKEQLMAQSSPLLEKRDSVYHYTP